MTSSERTLEHIVSVEIENITSDFPEVEILKIDISAKEDAAVTYALTKGGESWRRLEGDDGLELIVVTEIQGCYAPKEEGQLVQTLYAEGGAIAQVPLRTVSCSSEKVADYKDSPTREGTYLLTKEDRLLVGNFLGEDRYIATGLEPPSQKHKIVE